MTNHIGSQEQLPRCPFVAEDPERFLAEAHIAESESVRRLTDNETSRHIASAAMRLGGAPSTETERRERKEKLKEESEAIRIMELRATDSINADPSAPNVAGTLAESYGAFLRYYRTSLPDSAEYEAARRTRLIPFRIIGHRLAMNIVPLLSDVLQSPSLTDTLDLGGFMAPNATLSGDGIHGRVHHGDEARLGAALHMLLLPVVEKTVRELPQAVHAAASYTTKKQAEAATVQLHKEGLTWPSSLQESPFVVESSGDQRTYRQRFLEFQVSHLPTDPGAMMLELNLPNQVEHLISALGDLYRAYDLKETPREAQLLTSIKALRSFRLLAYLRNEIGGTIEYKDRYTWQSSIGLGRQKSQRNSLFSVNQDENGIWVASAVRPPFTSQLANRPGRCPGKDPVAPNEEQVDRRDTFLQEVTGITGLEEFPSYLYDGVAEPDVISTFAFVVIERLRDAGTISLTQREFVRHLGPAQQSDGATYRKG